MVRISYKVYDSIGIWEKIEGRDSVSEIHLSPALSGTLVIGDTQAEMKGGECRIETGALRWGTYSPRVYTSEGIIELEPLVICGERVTGAVTSERTLRAMLERLATLEENMKTLEERIAEQALLIKGNELFGE